MEMIKDLLRGQAFFSVNKIAIKRFGLDEAAVLSLLCDFEVTSKERTPDGWFPVNATTIQEELNIGRKPYDNALSALAASNLIETKLIGIPAKKHFRLNYQIILEALYNNQDCTNRANQFATNGQHSLSEMDNQDCTKGTALNNISIKEDIIKEDIIKEHEESLSKDKSSSKKKSVKEKVDLDYTFIEEPWKDAFRQWYNYKKERGELYKTQRTLEAAYELLKKYALNDPANAMQVVMQSIGNNYQGLFPLKQVNNGQPTVNASTSPAAYYSAISRACDEELKSFGIEMPKHF